MQRNVVRLCKTIVVQHFKLLTGLCPHAIAAITVKLFNQTLLADVEM
jgi:hypothetical protein